MSANNINNVVVNGRLTHDPKEYSTGGDNVYTLLRLAINRRVGDDKKRTIYYEVKVWNGHARACIEYLGKGSFVSVQGHLDQYDNTESGERWNFISAEQVEFGPGPKAASDEAADDE